MAVTRLSALVYSGLYADTRPTPVPNGTTYICSDTGNWEVTNDGGTTWVVTVTGLANIDFGTVPEDDFNAAADLAFNTAIPASNVADSVNDILLDQVKPRLPGSGTIAVSTDPATALASGVYKRQAGVNQVFQKAITSAANTNGLVTIATVTTAACLIKSIVVKAVTAAQADLTSAAVKGGASQAVTFISAVTAAKANITAVDQQVGYTGIVELAAGKTIVMDVQGTGATPVNLLVTIEYEAAVDTGYLV